jgi:GNAT superfamily N-acetyltransferase
MTKPFSDLALAQRLERAEGDACVQFAAAHCRLRPDCGADWMECAGAQVVFDGVDSPATQTFGLGLNEELIPDSLDTIESFFLRHGSPVRHEVSPFAGVPALDLLCRRNYRPIETASVLYQSLSQSAATQSKMPLIQSEAANWQPGEIRVRAIAPDEAELWATINHRGWASENPELSDFLLEFSSISAGRDHTTSFLAELDGEPGAAASLSIYEGVAVFSGATTVPEVRRRGLQSALLGERLRYGWEMGCDLAMMVTLPGSDSQRNAERNGFQIAYTRMKWQLWAQQRTSKPQEDGF